MKKLYRKKNKIELNRKIEQNDIIWLKKTR